MPAPPEPPDEHRALAGKTALVTGAYGDIGRHTAIGLARAGATVIPAGRNTGKLDQLAADIAAQVPGAQVEPLHLDLADLDSIHRAARTVTDGGSPLDVLVNNAAVMPGSSRQTTADGFELAFGTNVLGHYALTGLLLTPLLAAPEARVISLCAGPSNQRLDTSDLNSENRYRGGMRTYMASKLADAVFAQELARLAAGTSVKSLTVSPGTAATGVQRHNAVIGFLAKYVFAPITSTPEQAARPALFAATEPGLASGALVTPGRLGGVKGHPAPRTVPDAFADPDTGRALWQEAEQLTGIPYPFGAPSAAADQA